MRFQVPQFIEVEDKIFGPLTIKQFIYLAGGAGLSFVIYRFSPFHWIITLIIIAPFVALSLAFAFYKVNNKPFMHLLDSMIHYFWGDKLYIWKKTPKKIEQKTPNEEKEYSSVYVPRLSDSKLKDLTWSLDITENTNPGTNETMSENEREA